MILLVLVSALAGAQIRAADSSQPPKTTVAEYNADIDQNELLTTVTLTPSPINPILSYTYLQYPSGLRLPFRVKARILPSHLKGSNSRKGNDVDDEAEKNCDLMEKNNNAPNKNNDQYGHLVPYILGAPGAWYNVVPQTRRINLGTVTKTELVAPSLWSRTEREIREWVKNGGSMDYQVLVAYDLKKSNRPTGFGIIEHYKDSPDPKFNWKNNGYWFSNHPEEDPDVWNRRG